MDINVNAREVLIVEFAKQAEQPAATAQSTAATQHALNQTSPAGVPAAPIGGEDDLPF